MSFFSSSLAEEIVTPLKNSNVDNERNVRDSSISEYFEDVDAEFYKHAGLERYGEESAAEPTGRDLSPRRSRVLYGGDGAREAAGTDDDVVNDDSGLEMRRKPQLETPCVDYDSGVTTTFCSESEKDARAHPSKSLYDNWSCDEDLDDNRQQNYGKKKKRGKKLLPKFLTRKRNHPNSNQASSSSSSSSHSPENHETLHRHEQEEVDIGWKIMMFLLKTWFVIWVLFAIAAIATSLSHPHHPRKKVLNSQRNRDVPFDINQVHDSVIAAAAAGNADLENNTITNNYEMNDEQILMVISEQIITTCSTQNLITEKGRAECQTLCHGHMCCFMDDEDDDDVLVEMVESLDVEERKSYGCANDPEKMCAVYAGCEALVEDVDAPFSNTHHFDNEEMTKRPEREGGENDTKASENYSVEESSTQQQQQQQQQNSEQDQQHIIDATISSPTTSNPDTTILHNSELQLISEVITQTCSNENLHMRQGMLGCASLCQQSICCFDPNEIHELNPNMDLILRMEGVTDKLLNRTAIGTCIHEEEGEKGDFKSNHFCNIHKGCKNLLLFGKHSNPSHSKLKKKPPPSALGKGNSPIYLGVSSTNDSKDNEEDEDNNEWRYLVTYFFLFGIVIAITTYLLVFNRHASSMTFDIANTLREEGKSMDDYDDEIRQEMTEFV